jgi:hypothetical protein
MLMCVFFTAFAHETAGAARTRSSLRPLFFGGKRIAKLGRMLSRDRGVMSETPATESKTRGVLDTRLRGYDGGGWSIVIGVNCCAMTVLNDWLFEN